MTIGVIGHKKKKFTASRNKHTQIKTESSKMNSIKNMDKEQKSFERIPIGTQTIFAVFCDNRNCIPS